MCIRDSLTVSIFGQFFDLTRQIDIFCGHFIPGIVSAETDGDSTVNIGQLRVMIGLLTCKCHFSDEADGLGEAAEPESLADRVVTRRPTGQFGQGVLYLKFVECSAHKAWKVLENDFYLIDCFFQQRAMRKAACGGTLTFAWPSGKGVRRFAWPRVWPT